MKHFGFPSIDQYRNTIKTIKDRCEYHGLPLPTITFNGSVKLHGTNAGIVKDLSTGEIWAQSREQLITPESDNAGFARFVADNRIHFQQLFTIAQDLCGPGDAVLNPTHLAIYGEWCGKGIMKGVAINQLDKMFVIFGLRVINDVGETPVMRWFNCDELLILTGELQHPNGDGVMELDHTKPRIFCIESFQTWQVDVDFSKPELAQNELSAITVAVEAECPVGKAFGVSGVGEGVVWKVDEPTMDLADFYEMDAKHPGWDTLRVDDLIFKVKGSKHSDTKIPTLTEVDVVKAANARAYADAVITDHRLEKMVEKLKELKVPIDIKHTGDFLKLVGNDVIKEESDRLGDLTWKDVSGAVNTAAKQWWMKLLNDF